MVEMLVEKQWNLQHEEVILSIRINCKFPVSAVKSHCPFMSIEIKIYLNGKNSFISAPSAWSREPITCQLW